MSSAQIRAALLKLHSTRGRLSRFCKANTLNYHTLMKFMTTPDRQLEHDTAVAVINALPDDLKQQQLEAA